MNTNVIGSITYHYRLLNNQKKQGLDNPGVDGKRIEGVEITTKLKEEKKPEKVPIPAKAAKDTIVYQ